MSASSTNRELTAITRVVDSSCPVIPHYLHRAYEDGGQTNDTLRAITIDDSHVRPVAVAAGSHCGGDPTLANPRADSPTFRREILGGTLIYDPSRSRQPAPELNVSGIAGSSVNLGSDRGKVVLLDFWAVDCGLCVKEIPWYVEFDKKYHDQGLRLLGIDVLEESPAKIKPFMQKAHMNHPVAVGNDDIKNRFQAEELPKTLLIDRQGRVAVSHAGIVDRDEFERDIQELLKEQ